MTVRVRTRAGRGMAKMTTVTSRARASFLQHLQETGNVTASAKAAGFSRTAAYERRSVDPEFAAAWKEAEEIATDTLEAEARRRAIEGVEEPVYYLGKECGRIRKYSDRMLEILLKAHRPDKFRERISTELTGKDGGPVETAVTIRPQVSREEWLKLHGLDSTSGTAVSGD